MGPTAAYDEIADWYEQEFLGLKQPGDRLPAGDPIGIDRALRDLLGPYSASQESGAGQGSGASQGSGAGQGSGVCLEIGCGTGVRSATVRELGWVPVGADLSAGMLRHARGRLPVMRADAARLPVRDGSAGAVITVMAHTDMPAYPAVLREAARCLRPGGIMVHVGVHPCFCGGFADRTDPGAVLITPGYSDGHWTKAAWTDQGVRHKVGATHRPLAGLLHAFLDAGLHLERFAEGGEPTPTTLSVRARKPLA